MERGAFNDTPELRKTSLVPLEVALPIPLEGAFLVHVMEEGDLSGDLHIDPGSVSPTVLAPAVNVLNHLMLDSIVELRCPSADLSFYLSSRRS